MRLIAITRVKNEQDIIESFVRHTLAHFDQLIVLDHSSSDRTFAILSALKDEGLPLTVRHTTKLETQGAAMTALMREAFDKLGAEWVMPLDADEFVDTPAGSTLRDYLPRDAKRPLAVRWHNYAFMPDAPEPVSASNPAVALRWRARGDGKLRKIVIPQAVGRRRATEVYEGNHAITRRGEWQAATDEEVIALCHYPVRSFSQYASKIAIGSWRYLANPSHDGSIWGWHYREAYLALLSGDRAAFLKRMHDDSINYSTQIEAELVEQPMTYLGGALRYSGEIGREQDLLRNIFDYTELLARDYAAETRGSPLRRFFGRRGRK